MKRNTRNTIDDQADKTFVQICPLDLKSLLFWANVGIGYAEGGSYLGGRFGLGVDVRDVIESYAPYVKLPLKLNELGQYRKKRGKR